MISQLTEEDVRSLDMADVQDILEETPGWKFIGRRGRHKRYTRFISGLNGNHISWLDRWLFETGMRRWLCLD